MTFNSRFDQPFVDPVTYIAGLILVSVGILFATATIWSYFVDLLLPNP